jgi:siroheme synthase
MLHKTIKLRQHFRDFVMGDFVDRARQIGVAAKAERQSSVSNMALRMIGEITVLMADAAKDGDDQVVLTVEAYASEQRSVQQAMAEAAERLRLEDPELHVVHLSSCARCAHSTAPHYLGIGWNGEPEQIIELDDDIEVISQLQKT